MASFNQVGLSKNELEDVVTAMRYRIGNDVTMTQGDIDGYTHLLKIVEDMRARIIAYDIANISDTDPAAILQSAIRAL